MKRLLSLSLILIICSFALAKKSSLKTKAYRTEIVSWSGEGVTHTYENYWNLFEVNGQPNALRVNVVNQANQCSSNSDYRPQPFRVRFITDNGDILYSFESTSNPRVFTQNYYNNYTKKWACAQKIEWPSYVSPSKVLNCNEASSFYFIIRDCGIEIYLRNGNTWRTPKTSYVKSGWCGGAGAFVAPTSPCHWRWYIDYFLTVKFKIEVFGAYGYEYGGAFTGEWIQGWPTYDFDPDTLTVNTSVQSSIAALFP